MRFIDWDVVITPDGQVLIESNDNWEIGGPQDTHGGLKIDGTNRTMHEVKNSFFMRSFQNQLSDYYNEE